MVFPENPVNNDGSPHVSRSSHDRLYSAQIAQIYSQSTLGAWGALLGGIVLAVALWMADPQPAIIIWILFYFASVVAHCVLTRAFARRQPDEKNVIKWARRHWAVVISGSLAWTYAVIFLFPTDFLQLQIFMIIFVGGIVAGAAAIYSPTNEYLVSNLVILLPLSARFLYLGGSYNIASGSLLFGFGILMLVLGRSIHNLYSELLRIRFEREDLVNDLRDEISIREQVEADLREAKDGLEIRVAHRTSELQQRNLELFRQIAERLKIEDALRASENAYRSLSENIPGIVYRIRLDQNEVRFFGTGLEAISGFRESDINFAGSSAISQLILPEDVQGVISLIEQARARRGSFQANYRIRHKTGAIVWCADYGRFDSGEEVSTPHIDGVIFDITERKIAEEVIRQSEQKYRLLFDNAQESIIIVKDCGVRFWNPATLNLLGFSSEELPDMVLADLLHPDDRDTVLELYQKEISGEQTIDVYSFKIVGKDGTVSWVQANTVLIEWEGGPATLNFLTDITDLKKAEDFNVRMERLKAIGDLASGVAHNFNNMLQVVVAGVELALKQLDSGGIENIKQHLERIRESSRVGSETVKRLQRFAKIRPETASGEKLPLDLSEIVRQSIDLARPWWDSGPSRLGIRVELDVSLIDGCFVQGSENELVEVVINLIKNAAEAMPIGGHIGITTAIIQDRVVLEVRDNGTGITGDDLRNLFVPYWTTKGIEGTGMGLAVSRQIVNHHEGAITVASKIGEGTTFTIELPLAQRSSLELPVLSVTPQLNIKILVIDDLEQLGLLLQDLLESHGNQVLRASSGKKGIHLFRENEFDLVISDLGMPEMTGWEVGREVRSICEQKGIPKTPFILLTGWGGQSLEQSKILESGIDAVMEKPIETAKLLNVIKQLVFPAC